MSLLELIDSPAELKKLSISQLELLAQEIREKIITTVLKNGGHLASPLGVVELTLALHYVFDIRKDIIIWDVGHQAYAHKILTGRNKNFHTLRKKGGIGGYPSRDESPFDYFGTGHSSTSISAALGMAVARDLNREKHNVVAVIGDGAMTGGMAMEALNHAGHLGIRMIVVLNDNEMSIGPNTGALAKYFNKLITAYYYKRAKEDVGSFVKRIVGEKVTRTIQDLEKSVKAFITKGSLFQDLGFNYIGPVDGHDLPLLIECFERLKFFNEPVLFHCKTEKGKGYKEAELDPQKYHGISPSQFKEKDKEGESLPAHENGNAHSRTFTDYFSEEICKLGEEDHRIVAITAAMPVGTGLIEFSKKFPDRYFDVGICEQHAVTFAGGLSAQGYKPVVAIYSTFLQRAYDQIIHDICLQKLPVIFAIDRAGLVGEDGATHMGTFDISYLRAIPNLAICTPRDGEDLKLLLKFALSRNHPIAIRYPKCPAPTICPVENRNIAGADILMDGEDAYIIAIGPLVKPSLEVAQQLNMIGFSVGVIDARWIKPLDSALLSSISTPLIFTVEENTLEGGFGSAVLEFYNENTDYIHNYPKIIRIGISNPFCQHASRAEQLEMAGLTYQKLNMKIESELKKLRENNHCLEQQIYITSCKNNKVCDNLFIPKIQE
ncbi:MAG: 1-deoxy-D-xylulose-5-phosphate synthase [Candidatus Hydrogenedentes bacterium]|nr:1-deoxy-D-xylulose-5-phosphate synthase [Candidatus Hydrogenedentota bacterium]